jgi:flagellar basal-body rod modification protein FlgD
MTDPIASALAGQATPPLPRQAGTPSVSQSEFLTLFVTQLQHQDPLSPLEPDQLTAQLAQFASLEQLTGVNTRLDQLSVLSQQGLLSLIGRDVAFGGGGIAVEGGEASTVAYEVPAAAAKVVATVRGADGAVVRVVDLGAKDVGRHEFVFDGRDAEDTTVPDGRYRVEIAAIGDDDTPVPLAMTIRDTVDGVDFSVEPPVLLVGGLRIPLDEVHEVRVDERPAGDGSDG